MRELTENDLQDLITYAEDKIEDRCIERGEGEYIDDVKWGTDNFSFSIFKGRNTKVVEFFWTAHLDDPRDAQEQLDAQINEFLNTAFPEEIKDGSEL